MNSPRLTDLTRRNKTCSDQQSVLSYTTSQSVFSTGRKSQVKATCKVVMEMREEESSKLALKFNQLKIVLGTQSLMFVISKYKSVKMQTYFWLLKEPNQENHIIETLPIEDNKLSKLLVLDKLFKSRYAIVFQCINSRHQITQGSVIIGRIMKSKQVKMLYQILLAINRYQRPIQKTSILEQNCIESDLCLPENEELEDQGTISDFEQEQSLKQQLAIKFACMTMMIGLLQRKLILYEFRFIMNLQMGEAVNQFQTQHKIVYKEKGEVKLGSVTGIGNVSPSVGAKKIYSVLLKKLQQHFQVMKTYVKEEGALSESNETNTTIVLHDTSDVANLMDNSLHPAPHFAQQNIKRVTSEEFGQPEQSEQSESHQDSLMDITDIDVENSNRGELENSTKPLKSMIFQKNRRPSNFVNAIRSYCNEQFEVQPKLKLPKYSPPPKEITVPQTSHRWMFIQMGIILLAMLFYMYI